MNDDVGHARGSVVGRLLEGLADDARAATVAEVRVGLGYTAVALSDARTGVAFTFNQEAHGGCAVFDGLRPLAGRRAAELLPLAASRDVIEAAVGLACANALANQPRPAQLGGDVLDHLAVGPDDAVGMVGHFGPVVPELERRCRSLTIFERVAAPTGALRPAEEAISVLPRCQVAMITATAIVNQTIDRLLDAARGCREVVVLGASTPLWPAAFSGTPVTLLSGVIVSDSAELLRVVSEGGGMRQFRRLVHKVSLRVQPDRGVGGGDR